jgi:hypothetical protein
MSAFIVKLSLIAIHSWLPFEDALLSAQRISPLEAGEYHDLVKLVVKDLLPPRNGSSFIKALTCRMKIDVYKRLSNQVLAIMALVSTSSAAN